MDGVVYGWRGTVGGVKRGGSLGCGGVIRKSLNVVHAQYNNCIIVRSFLQGYEKDATCDSTIAYLFPSYNGWHIYVVIIHQDISVHFLFLLQCFPWQRTIV